MCRFHKFIQPFCFQSERKEHAELDEGAGKGNFTRCEGSMRLSIGDSMGIRDGWFYFARHGLTLPGMVRIWDIIGLHKACKSSGCLALPIDYRTSLSGPSQLFDITCGLQSGTSGHCRLKPSENNYDEDDQKWDIPCIDSQDKFALLLGRDPLPVQPMQKCKDKLEYALKPTESQRNLPFYCFTKINETNEGHEDCAVELQDCFKDGEEEIYYLKTSNTSLCDGYVTHQKDDSEKISLMECTGESAFDCRPASFFEKQVTRISDDSVRCTSSANVVLPQRFWD